MKKILKCISTVEELDVNIYNNLGIGVEIQDFTEPNLDEREVVRITSQYKALFKKFKGTKALHGPFLDLKPASPDPLIRKVSYKRYLDSLNIAGELNMDYIIFHSQINPYLKLPSLINLNNKQASDFWHKILAEVKIFDGTILIENIFEEDPCMIKKYMETVNINNIKVNLDIGHAKLSNLPLEDWIKELKEYIGYFHVHSNDGKYDLHKSLEDREIESLHEILYKYNIDVPLALEYKVNDLEEEIKRYRKN